MNARDEFLQDIDFRKDIGEFESTDEKADFILWYLYRKSDRLPQCGPDCQCYQKLNAGSVITISKKKIMAVISAVLAIVYGIYEAAD